MTTKEVRALQTVLVLLKWYYLWPFPGAPVLSVALIFLVFLSLLLRPIKRSDTPTAIATSFIASLLLPLLAAGSILLAVVIMGWMTLLVIQGLERRFYQPRSTETANEPPADADSTAVPVAPTSRPLNADEEETFDRLMRTIRLPNDDPPG